MEESQPTLLKQIHFPRKYQLEVLDSVLRRNTLAFLPTGSGKTLISVLLIKNRLDLIRAQPNYKQVIAFLAPTKILVGQQKRYIIANTDAIVRSYTGETRSHDGVAMDNWNVSHWERERSLVEVMILTPEIMRNVLERSLLPLHAFDCVILDECHHAFGRHPMALVCDFINNKVVKPSGTRIRNTYRPHILGMTASPLGCKKGSVAEKILQLEKTTGCILVAPKDTIQELREVVPVPNFCLQRYTKDSGHVFGSPIEPLLSSVADLTATLDFFHINSFSFSNHPIPILLQAFLRIRHAAYISDVYFLLRICSVEANALPELDGLMLPLRETWNKPHDRLVATYNEKVSAAQSAYSNLKSDFYHYGGQKGNTKPATSKIFLYRSQKDARLHAGSVSQVIQQILTILEEAGVLCALHAYRYAMTPNHNDAEYIRNFASQMKSSSFSSSSSSAAISPSFPETSATRKVSYRVSGGRKSMANIDSDQIIGLKHEILRGPFSSLELVDCDYCIRSSLLECFAALASLLGLENCKKAARDMRSCRDTVYENMCELHTPESEETKEVPQELRSRRDSPDYKAEGDSNSEGAAGSKALSDDTLLEGVVDMAMREDNLEVEFGKGWGEDITYVADPPDSLNSAPCSSTKSGAPAANNTGTKKHSASHSEINAKEITAIEIVIRLLNMVGNGDKEAIVDYGTVGIAECLWTYGHILEARAFPSLHHIKSAISVGCLFLLNTIQPYHIVQHIQHISHEFEYEDLPQTNLNGLLSTSSTKSGPEADLTLHFSKPSFISRKVCGVILDLFQRSEDGWRIWVNLVNKGSAIKCPSDKSIESHGISKLREGWSGIVFCRMRLTSIALSEMITTIQTKSKKYPKPIDNEMGKLHARLRAHAGRELEPGECESDSDSLEKSHSAANEGNGSADDDVDFDLTVEDFRSLEAPEMRTVFPIRPHFIIGSSSQKEQMDALHQFKAGYFNVLIATDVVEEGLDVGDCQLIINFDPPDSVKSFIQRRGRARAADSFMIALVPKGEEGIAIIEDFARYRKQEFDMNVHGQNNSESNGDSNFKDIFEYCNRRSSFDPTDDDIVDDDVPDTIDDSVVRDLIMERYYVKTTGAFVDAGCSVQVLIQYCQQLPHDSYHLPHPIFHMCPGYRCAILLPPAVPAEIRCIMGPSARKKGLAKALASLECLRRLHQAGELNDWLLPVSKYGTEKPTVEEKEGAKAGTKRKTCDDNEVEDSVTENNRKQAKEGGIEHSTDVTFDEENVVKIRVKIVPDSMLPEASSYSNCADGVGEKSTSNGTSKGTKLFFYATRCWPAKYNERLQNVATLGCHACGTHAKAVNRIAIGLLKRISEDVLDTVFDMNLKRLIFFEGKFEYLGSRVISDEEMVHMQRFHRHTMCWDTFHPGSTDNKSSLDDSSVISKFLIPPDEWSASSNGAWYIVLPLPEIYETFDSYTADLIPVERDEDMLSFLSRDYLKKVADEAYELVKNLSDHNKLQTDTNPPQMLPRQSHHASDLVGCIFRRDTVDLFAGLPMKNVRKISDIVLPGKLEKSFYEYYISKGKFPLELLDEIKEKHGHQLIHGLGVSGRLSLIPLFLPLGSDIEIIEFNNANKKVKLARRKEVFDRVTWAHKHSSSIHLIPEVCEVLGKSAWFYIGQFAPSIVWRLQSLLLTQEARCRIATAASQQTVSSFDISKPIDEEESNRPKKFLRIDDRGNEGTNQRVAREREYTVHENALRIGKFKMPSVELLLEAITPRMALEPLNSERLEMLGDSFLKFSITVEIYRLNPDKHEGHLSSLRGKYVSNENLIRIAKKFGLIKYLRPIAMAKGKQTLIFPPSGMKVSGGSETEDQTCLWNKCVIKSKKVAEDDTDIVVPGGDGGSALDNEFYMDLTLETFGDDDDIMSIKKSVDNKIKHALDVDAASAGLVTATASQFSHAYLRKKCLADIVESIIGAFYVQGGVESAVAVMKAFGLWPEPSPERRHSNGSTDDKKEVAPAELPAVDKENAENIEPLALKQPIIPENYPKILTRMALGLNTQVPDDTNHQEEKINIKPNNPALGPSPITTEKKSRFIIDSVANKLGYRFQNYDMLDLALTHCSCINKQSNQRLEFLGDAVLDFAIVSLLFKNQRRADPGQLSQQKSEAARNRRLAAISLKIEVYKHMNIFSPPLMAEFDNLELKKGLEKKSKTGDGVGQEDGRFRSYGGRNFTQNSSSSSKRNGLSGKDKNPLTVTEALDKDLVTEYRILDSSPKSINGALADLMEALIGAIFIDCKGSLEEINNLIYRLNILPQLNKTDFPVEA